MSKYTLSVTNKKLYEFYNKNSHLNFEAVNLVFHDILVKLTENMSETMSSTINSEILSNIQKQDVVINELKGNLNIAIENINKIKQETAIFSELKNDILNINNNVSLKFVDFKNEYISGVKSLLIENNDRNSIVDIIQKSNETFIDKTKLLLNENISSLIENNNKSTINNTKLLLVENNDKYISQIDNTINTFQRSISDELNKLTNNNDDNAIKDFISTFDSKCSNMFQTAQQPVYTILQSTEERIQNNIQNIKDNMLSSQSKHENTMDELSAYLRKFNNSSYKGAIGECELESVLNKMYPSAEIINTSGVKSSGDFMMKRENKPNIMLENKVYDRNVNPDEIQKFIRDVEEIKTHAIFLSQNSGISRKKNFQVDVHKGLIMIYIHNVQYSPEKIQIAIDIIENLAERIEEIDSEEEHENVISKSLLDEINQEYLSFNKQKDEIILMSKDYQKKLIGQLENLKMNALNKYLSTKYSNNEKTGFSCEYCNVFSASTKKSLSAHVRACKKNHDIKVDTTSNLNIQLNNNSSDGETYL
jgi:hypothetical protein